LCIVYQQNRCRLPLLVVMGGGWRGVPWWHIHRGIPKVGSRESIIAKALLLWFDSAAKIGLMAKKYPFFGLILFSSQPRHVTTSVNSRTTLHVEINEIFYPNVLKATDAQYCGVLRSR
jgi:hypothetical protein